MKEKLERRENERKKKLGLAETKGMREMMVKERGRKRGRERKRQREGGGGEIREV